MTTVEKIAKATHIKWLSKADTAKLNGSEMTVLSYGYLETAVKEALTELETKVREDEKKKLSRLIIQSRQAVPRVITDYLRAELRQQIKEMK